VIVLETFGGTILETIAGLIRKSLSEGSTIAPTLERFTEDASAVGFEVGIALFGSVSMIWLGAVLIHQAQVWGLWAPGLAAPRLDRLWAGGSLLSAARLGRGAWLLARSIAVIACAVILLEGRLPDLESLGRLDVPSMLRLGADILRRYLGSLASITIVIGIIDYGLQRRRLQAQLMTTPAESREERKSMDGDPALRAKRSRIARSWRGDAPELLAGATLAVRGDAGLIVVLAGGPPPRRVHLRASAKGAVGSRLRRAVERAAIPVVEDPELARRLAGIHLPTIPPEIVAPLKSSWPTPSGS
jgi:flagellar biosynthetic protein FlhB